MSGLGARRFDMILVKTQCGWLRSALLWKYSNRHWEGVPSGCEDIVTQRV
jgi:hypothetical protein